MRRDALRRMNLRFTFQTALKIDQAKIFKQQTPRRTSQPHKHQFAPRGAMRPSC
jgi:hypothetical protein